MRIIMSIGKKPQYTRKLGIYYQYIQRHWQFRFSETSNKMTQIIEMVDISFQIINKKTFFFENEKISA